MSQYPRVLFITSAAFNNTTGGGITFTNLFRGWPKDSLATIHNDPVPVTMDVCEHYYRLTDNEVRRWGVLSLTGSPNYQFNTETKTLTNKNRVGWKQRCKQLIFGDGLPVTVRLSSHLRQWISDYKPDLIYTILGSNTIMQLVDDIADAYQLPIVIHMMDDWPSTIYRGGLLSFLQRRKMQTLLASIVKRATLRMGISHAMCDAYSTRYDVSFVPFHNTIDVEKWEKSSRKTLECGEHPNIVYIGSIFANAQLDSLIDCCKAVSSLFGSNRHMQMNIYSPAFLSEQYRSELERDRNIRLHDTVTDDARFYELLATADVLLLPVNFDEQTVRFIRYSMPTKVPAYQLSGTPILVYGPTGVAQVDYAAEAGWGHVVSRRDVGYLASAIEELLTNLSLRQQLSATAKQVVRQNHDSRYVRDAFQSLLCSGCHA